MTQEDLDQCLGLLAAATHGVTIEDLNVSASVSGTYSATAEGSRRRAERVASGECEVHLWTLPRPTNEPRPRPSRSWLASWEQAQRLISAGAADQRSQ